ncbi:hypothetical protein ACFL5A_03890, partial [Gemmatimonadota bacterium]
RSGDPEDDFLGNMVAEWTARTMGQVTSLEIVPSAVVAEILGGFDDPSSVSALELARQAGARYAVTGNLTRLGSSLRFEAELVEVATGQLVVSLPPVAGPPDSLEALVERASDAVAAGTVATLRPGPWSLEGFSLPPTMESYQAFSVAQEAFCESSYDDAAEALYRATSTAPDWPFPYLYLVPTLQNAGRHQEIPSVLEDLEPLLPRLTGMENLFLQWLRGGSDYEQYRAAEEFFAIDSVQFGYALAFAAQWINRMDRARAGVLAIDFEDRCTQNWSPNYVLAAQTLHLVGEDEAALERALDGRRRFGLQRSLVMVEARARAGLGDVEGVLLLADTVKNAPSSTTSILSSLLEMGLELRVHGYPEEGAALLENARAWADQYPDMDSLRRARLLYYLEWYEEALPLFQTLAQESPGSTNLGYLALTLDALGRPAEADSVLEGFQERFPRSPYPALLAARRGDARRAVELLQANFDAGMIYYHNGQVNLHTDPDLAPIRDHPLFRELMRFGG